MSSVEKPFVLLVDDNEATCTLITAVLQREFTVEVAADGNDAIEKLRTGRYAAILLDLLMPQTDGFSVLEWLKEHSPARLRNVLIVTAALRDKELSRAKAFDICGVITKPFDVDALLDAVKQCVSGGDGNPIGSVLYSSGTVIILLADLLRQRLM
jgi:CheY-like chemotaxis protein